MSKCDGHPPLRVSIAATRFYNFMDKGAVYRPVQRLDTMPGQKALESRKHVVRARKCCFSKDLEQESHVFVHGCRVRRALVCSG